jgi:hypothetical protein
MNDNKGKDLWYELKGVIEHKGPSVSDMRLPEHHVCYLRLLWLFPSRLTMDTL